MGVQLLVLISNALEMIEFVCYLDQISEMIDAIAEINGVSYDFLRHQG